MSEAEVSFRAQTVSALLVLVAEHRYSPNSITRFIGCNRKPGVTGGKITSLSLSLSLTSLKTSFLKPAVEATSWVTLVYTLAGLWAMGAVVVNRVLVVVVVVGVVVVVVTGTCSVSLPVGASVGGGGGVTTGGVWLL